MIADNSDANAAREIEIQNSIRDGYLVKFHFHKPDQELTIFLSFENENDGRRIDLELRGVTEFDFSYQEREFPQLIAFVKCLMTDQDGFYLSLDPWREGMRFMSENDRDVFRSKFFSLTIS